MSTLSKSSLTAAVALGLALLGAGGEAALAAFPNASSQISGWCSAYKIDSASADLYFWDESNATGAPLTDSRELLDLDGMGHDAFASGEDRRAEVGWTVGSSERQIPRYVVATWEQGDCGDSGHSFTNTFTVMAAEGSLLEDGDAVTLSLDTQLIGELWVGSMTETLAQGGKWSAYSEVETAVELRTEAAGTWLAGAGTFANVNAFARADKPEDADGSVDHDLYREWWTQSNIAAYADGDWSEYREICADFNEDTGCSIEPNPPFAGFYIDEAHPVTFATQVGARVTLTAYLQWFGEFTVHQQGYDWDANAHDYLHDIYSDGYFTGDNVPYQPRGLSASVSAVTEGVEIVWDVEPGPPPPKPEVVFADSFENLAPK
jgi:hypothetical protein